MTRSFAIALLGPKRELLAKILAFNGLRAEPKPHQQLAGKALWEKIAALPTAWRLRGPGGALLRFEFEKPFNRLILLDRGSREKLAYYLGVCLWAPEIARLIKRDDVEAVRKVIPAECYGYACANAQLALSHSSRMILRGGDTDFTTGKIIYGGKTCLGLLTRAADPLYRLDDDEIVSRPADVDTELRMNLWRLTVRVLTSEIDASWQNIIS